MTCSIIKTLFFKIKIQPNTSEQEKKRQRIYDLLKAESRTTFPFFFLPYSNQRKNIQEKSFLRKGDHRGLNKKRTEHFLTGLVTVITKDSTTSIRKQANELKGHEKNVRSVITPVLSPLISLYGTFLKKQMLLSTKILVRLRLL